MSPPKSVGPKNRLSFDSIFDQGFTTSHKPIKKRVPGKKVALSMDLVNISKKNICPEYTEGTAKKTNKKSPVY